MGPRELLFLSFESRLSIGTLRWSTVGVFVASEPFFSNSSINEPPSRGSHKAGQPYYLVDGLFREWRLSHLLTIGRFGQLASYKFFRSCAGTQRFSRLVGLLSDENLAKKTPSGSSFGSKVVIQEMHHRKRSSGGLVLLCNEFNMMFPNHKQIRIR